MTNIRRLVPTGLRSSTLSVCGALGLLVAGWTSQRGARAEGVLVQPPLANENARAEEVRKAPVVVVTGSADHMEQVLRRAQARFVVVRPEELATLPLHSQQVLMVNCRGEMSQPARERVRRFVAAGGFLYTTDHAVHELVEKIFPNTIRWNHKTTQQEVFPLQVFGTEASRGLIRHLGSSASQRWQVAGGGYLIDVVDPHRVETLMESKQVAARYGSGTIGVRFRYEDGYVIHVTGHFYTQPGQQPEVASAGATFERFSANVIESKAADKGRIDSMYNQAPKREVMLQAAPTAAAPAVSPDSVTTQTVRPSARVKVLERKPGYLKVRDDQGNEGWAVESAF
jgi:hypothetical protein